MGWIGWTVVVLLLVAGSLALAFRPALSRDSVALLDRGDDLLRIGEPVRLVASTLYGADPAQKVRVYRPDSAGERVLPVIVFVHGGSWASGDPDDYGFVARALAPEGYVVVLAGYRLYPHARFPAMVEDTAAAVRWVESHAGQFAGDPARIVLIGHSAGAYNVAMATLDRRYFAAAGVDPGAIRGVVGLAGPYDFLPLATLASIASFGDAPDKTQTQPIRFVRTDAPPLLLLTGADDTTVKPRNSLELAKAMSAIGVATKAEVLTGVSHAGILMKLARPFSRDHRVLDAILPFLARVTAASARVQADAGKPAG